MLDLLVTILHAEGRLGPAAGAAAAAAPAAPDGPVPPVPRARGVLLRCGLGDLVRGVLREAVRLQAGEVRAGVGGGWGGERGCKGGWALGDGKRKGGLRVNGKARGPW